MYIYGSKTVFKLGLAQYHAPCANLCLINKKRVISVVFCTILINFWLFPKHYLTTDINECKKTVKQSRHSKKHIVFREKLETFWFDVLPYLLFLLNF
ncbi:hypothetical protein CRG49_002540 [Neisseria sp. N95_16]|nr:hypothetical protein CRG49_002540 [Neisseria sp. N95_16]PJO77323.1 hypothetical protein CWC45_11005 [Neisseria sp. N177_16]